MALFIGAIAVYMRLYGNAHIKKALSELAGSPVEFRNIALNLGKGAASFQGFTIASRIGFDKNVFSADTFTVTINKEKLEAEKKIVFDRIYVKGARLTIIRDSRGVLNLAIPPVNTARLEPAVPGFESVAFAAAEPSKNPLYDVLKSVGNIRVEESTVSFEDRFKMAAPYTIWCDKFFADITSKATQAGYLQTTIAVSLRIPQKEGGNGSFNMKTSMAVYPDNTNMELYAETGNIDLRILHPYFARNTPFMFRSGFFSSSTDFRMHGGQVDSLTTMYVRRLSLSINMRDPNAQFLNVSINRLAPYLRSGENIVFDFTVTGDARKPQFSAGPRIKFAMGMVAMEEVAKAIQQFQR